MADADPSARPVSNADALFAPAVARNKDAILDVLAGVLPRRGLVLEVASGSGEHATHFATALPDLEWQPSDPDENSRRSIVAHARASELTNLLPPLALDVMIQPWPLKRADAIVAINMIHIAPWAATAGLLAGAEALLPANGVVYLYGPFKHGGEHTAPSNAAFDASLRARNPARGVRDLEAVAAVADTQGFQLIKRVAMPANNLSLIFRKVGGAGRRCGPVVEA